MGARAPGPIPLRSVRTGTRFARQKDTALQSLNGDARGKQPRQRPGEFSRVSPLDLPAETSEVWQILSVCVC
jgi:hypothetical protein